MRKPYEIWWKTTPCGDIPEPIRVTSYTDKTVTEIYGSGFRLVYRNSDLYHVFQTFKEAFDYLESRHTNEIKNAKDKIERTERALQRLVESNEKDVLERQLRSWKQIEEAMKKPLIIK